MYNFLFHVPTKVYFGRGQISHLGELSEYGKKVLLVYGGGSIKRNGLYDTAVGILHDAGMEIFELAGVEPNPKIETVRKGVEICREQGVDVVLAIGGGSTIDCAKIVAAGTLYDGDAWDLVLDGSKMKKALPIASVLTISATGSEMDRYAVISDLGKNEKWSTDARCLIPSLSILDPSYTFSVSKRQTAAGTADIMSHIFESYFTTEPAADVQRRIAEGLLKVVFKYGPVALNEPDNYDARANLMWVASHAINGLIADGAEQHWCVHPIEHELSAFYDITHGEGLAILTPVWMEYILDENTKGYFADYGRNVWSISEEDDLDAAKAAIEKTRSFLQDSMGLPSNLRAVGITDDRYFDQMAEKAARSTTATFVPLTKEDIKEIYRRAF